jgi:hypothetical protein
MPTQLSNEERILETVYFLLASTQKLILKYS